MIAEIPTPRSSSGSTVNLGFGEIAQPLPEVNGPAEDPTSDEEEDFLVYPSPVRPQPSPANAKNTTSPTGDDPLASVHTHLRISHAELRSLPNVTVELDSDGDEISSDGGFSVPTTSQIMLISSTGSSYLDLDGTLPSAVGDFLDMIDTDTFPDV
jgi:hypothetical protein